MPNDPANDPHVRKLLDGVTLPPQRPPEMEGACSAIEAIFAGIALVRQQDIQIAQLRSELDVALMSERGAWDSLNRALAQIEAGDKALRKTRTRRDIWLAAFVVEFGVLLWISVTLWWVWE